MAPVADRRLWYSIAVRDGGTCYRHCDIELHLPCAFTGIDRDKALRFTWQRGSDNHDPNMDKWYAFTIELGDSGVSLTHMRIATKLAGRIIRPGTKCTPADIVARLEKLGAVQVVYDSRESGYVELADVADPDMKSWRDDWRTMGEDRCHVGAIAYDARGAKADIGAALAKNPNYDDYLVRWIAAGRPVIAITYDKAPDTRTAMELVA